MGVESSIAAQLCFRVVLLCGSVSDLDGSIGSGSPSWGRPAFSFIGQGKARVIAEEKEKNEREEGLQDRRVLLLLNAGPADPIDVNRDGSYVAVLSVTGAMRRRHPPVMALHSVLADVMVN